MPGPVSDSYDPEFGTGSNADDVKDGIEKIVVAIGNHIGTELKNIIEVVHGPEGNRTVFALSEREMRIIRFALNRSLETI